MLRLQLRSNRFLYVSLSHFFSSTHTKKNGVVSVPIFPLPSLHQNVKHETLSNLKKKEMFGMPKKEEKN